MINVAEEMAALLKLGKQQPYWIPDNVSPNCMQCNLKFSIIKRRHHCRACGQVLCATCCSLKAKLEYMGDADVRICVQCDVLLNQYQAIEEHSTGDTTNDGASRKLNDDEQLPESIPNRNKLEYSSVKPPPPTPTSSTSSSSHTSPSAMPIVVGVLKRDRGPTNTTTTKSSSRRKDKNVMFSDGIRPGCDLTDLDNWANENKKKNIAATSNTTTTTTSIKSNNKNNQI